MPGPASHELTSEPASVVAGYCPMGCGPHLALTAGGHITCMRGGCPRPRAVDELLQDRETEHVVELGETEFTIRHPLRERLDDELMRCGLYRVITGWSGPMEPPGRYRVQRARGVGYTAWNWSSCSAAEARP